jgi:hypothetical protein
MKQPYAVLDQFDRMSKYGNMITQVTLVGIKDRKEYVTYVDPNNGNHSKWYHITIHTEHGFVLNNLRLKKVKDKDNIINADSDPLIECEMENKEEMLKIVQEHWAREDERNGRTSFWSMVE